MQELNVYRKDAMQTYVFLSFILCGNLNFPMKLFLHLELRPWQDTRYEKPLLSFASSLSSDVIGAEIDNRSEASVVDVVIKLCSQMDKIFVFIQAQPEESFGATLKLLNHLLKNENQVHTMVLAGENERAEKLLLTLGHRFNKEGDAEKIKEWIKDFALA
jgi:hypothetical protein